MAAQKETLVSSTSASTRAVVLLRKGKRRNVCNLLSRCARNVCNNASQHELDLVASSRRGNREFSVGKGETNGGIIYYLFNLLETMLGSKSKTGKAIKATIHA